MAIRIRLDDHGPAVIATCADDGVWSVLEGGYDPDFLEEYLNVLWGPNWQPPPLTYFPSGARARAEAVLKEHKGEILHEDIPATEEGAFD